jgi:hypothetical protein
MVAATEASATTDGTTTSTNGGSLSLSSSSSTMRGWRFVHDDEIVVRDVDLEQACQWRLDRGHSLVL